MELNQPMIHEMKAENARRYMVLWIAFVIYSAAMMAYEPLLSLGIVNIGPIALYPRDVLLFGALLLGTGPLLRMAGETEASLCRRMSRIIIMYLLFELLFVFPIGVWAGTASVPQILRSMDIRLTWLLFPIVAMISLDDRERRNAAVVPIIAAAFVVLYGLYLAMTGGGGYYIQDGGVRFRILAGSAVLLSGWPFIVAVSGLASRRSALFLLTIALIGLGLTNHRTGMLAFALAGLACVVWSRRLGRLAPYAVPAALVATIALLVWGNDLKTMFGFTTGHIVDFSSTTAADRLTRWRWAWESFLARPINDWVWSWRWYLVSLQPYGPHNAFLDIAVTEGVAGLLFYGAMLWFVCKGAWSLVWKDAQARALAGYLILYIVFSLGNEVWYQTQSLPLLVATVAALAARSDQLSVHKLRIGQGSPSLLSDQQHSLR